MQIEENISLAQFSTLRVGGSADFFARVRNLSELKSALEFADSKKIPVFVLGGGSNILFADTGFRGLVIRNEIGGIEFANNFVHVGSGENLANLIAQTAQKNLAGLENLAGVPGSVGGAVVGNSNEIGEKIARVTILENGVEKIIPRADLKFEYRDSNLREKILIAVEFELEKSSLDLPKIIQTKIAEKVQQQEFKNTAGSWFKNPVGGKAWELIEKSGARDLQIGGARISAKHANFFENAGGATAADFLELEKIVQAKVKEKFGIELDREVVFVDEK
ncbi:MAG: UDP-N-acetylmuramate dehydrogenase [Patescibacteria group bacterium]